MLSLQSVTNFIETKQSYRFYVLFLNRKTITQMVK